MVKKIKHKYPMFEIIQIGANDRYGIISNTNKNLLGKTNFEELAVILKNAIIFFESIFILRKFILIYSMFFSTYVISYLLVECNIKVIYFK